VLWTSAPDCHIVRCTTTVQGSTSHSQENACALRYNSPDCPVPAGNGYLRATVDSDKRNSELQCAAEVRAAKSEGTGLSGVAPDYPVPHEDKAPTVDFAPNPNSWVTWRRTAQRTVPVRCAHRQQPPNGYESGWINTPTTSFISIQVF
jgi:hypothetical protein